MMALRHLAGTLLATIAAVSFVIATVIYFDNSILDAKTTAWAIPIIAVYVIGYCVIAFLVLSPIILLLDRFTADRTMIRRIIIILGGPILGIVAAIPIYYFQHSGELFHHQEGRFSDKEISNYFILLGAFTGFFGSIGFLLGDSLKRKSPQKNETG